MDKFRIIKNWGHTNTLWYIGYEINNENYGFLETYFSDGELMFKEYYAR